MINKRWLILNQSKRFSKLKYTELPSASPLGPPPGPCPGPTGELIAPCSPFADFFMSSA